MAIGVLAIAGLALLAALTRGISSQNYSSYQTAATLIAEAALQEAVLAGPDDWGMADPNIPEVRFASVGQNDSPTAFYFLPDPPPYLVRQETSQMMGSLYEVQIRVWWMENADGPERGARELRVSKMVYIER